MSALEEIQGFLRCPTPAAWIAAAPAQLGVLLVDHANCEKKAAATALSLIHRYPDDFRLLGKLAKLGREELLHFERVVAQLQARGIAYAQLPAGRYAARLHREIRAREPGRRVDTLLVGALIEARSCERFALLAPHLDDALAAFYGSLLKSEARHYRDYLALAREAAGAVPIEARLAHLLDLERELVETPDELFRFHSGPPRPPVAAG